MPRSSLFTVFRQSDRAGIQRVISRDDWKAR